MRHTRTAAAALALLAAPAGCLDFVRPTTGPGNLEVSLRLTDGDSVVVHLTGRFDPGTDEPGGEFRHLADPALRALDRTVEPAPLPPAGPREYRETWAVEPALLDRTELELEGPRLEERPSPVVAPLPVVWRSGPASVRLAGGDDLELPLRGVPDTIDGRAAWELEIRESGPRNRLSRERRLFYRAEGRRSLPDTVGVDGSVFARLRGPETFDVSLEVVLQPRVPPQDPGYRTFVDVAYRLRWELDYAPGGG